MPLKPGHKTSEFRMALGTILGCLAAGAGALALLPVSAPVVAAAAVAAAILGAAHTSVGYSNSRGNAKRNERDER